MIFAALVTILAASSDVAQATGSTRLSAEKPCGALCTAQGALNRLADFSILPMAYAAPEDTIDAAAEEVKIKAGETGEATVNTAGIAAEKVEDIGQAAKENAYNSASQAADEAADAGQAAKDTASKAASQVKEGVADVKARAKAGAEDLKNNAQASASAMNDMVKEAVNEFQKRQAAAVKKAKEAAAVEQPEPTYADKAKEYYGRAYEAIQDVMKRMMATSGKAADKVEGAAGKVKQEL